MLQKSEDSSSIGIGILMPVLSHRWRGYFETTDYNYDTIKRQTTKCNVDFINKQVHLEIEQDVRGLVYVELQAIIKDSSSSFYIEALSGNGSPYHTLHFHCIKFIKHDVEFNYAKSEAVHHEITLSFQSVDVIGPVLK